MAGTIPTVAEAVGRLSQVALIQYHPRTARSLIERLQPLVAVAGSLAVHQLTPDVLRRAVPRGIRHPERIRQAHATFLDFCGALGWINIEAPDRLGPREGLTRDDWRRLLHVIPDTWQGARDRLILHLAYYLAMTADEIRALNRETFTPFQVRRGAVWVPLPPEVESAALGWYRWRHGRMTYAVFIRPDNTPDPLRTRTLNRRIAAYAQRAHLEGPVTLARIREAGHAHRHQIGPWVATPPEAPTAGRPGFRRVDFAQLLRMIRGDKP